MNATTTSRAPRANPAPPTAGEIRYGRHGQPLYPAPGGKWLPKGRQKGSKNRASRELAVLCRELTLGNPTFVSRLRHRLENFEVDSSLIIRILEYAYGRPQDIVRLPGDEHGLQARIIMPEFRSMVPDTLRVDDAELPAWQAEQDALDAGESTE